MFSTETYADIATIVAWAKKNLSAKTIGAAFTVAKDIIAVVAKGVTSGLPFLEWENQPDISALFDRAEASGEILSDLLKGDYPISSKKEEKL